MAKVNSRTVQGFIGVWLMHLGPPNVEGSILDHVIYSGFSWEMPSERGTQRHWDLSQEGLRDAAFERYQHNPKLILTRCRLCRPGWARYLVI